MKTPLQNDSYRIINLVFAGIILAVIAYSFVFGGGRDHPVPSGSEILTGQNSISTGLSRSFSAIVRLDLKGARAYNIYGIRIFMFFLIQLVMRVAGLRLAHHPKRNRMIILDCMVSIILFVVFFWPFIANIYDNAASIP